MRVPVVLTRTGLHCAPVARRQPLATLLPSQTTNATRKTLCTEANKLKNGCAFFF